jgi:hypothetical protein
MIPWWLVCLIAAAAGFSLSDALRDRRALLEKRKLTHFCDECGSFYNAIEAAKDGRGALGHRVPTSEVSPK